MKRFVLTSLFLCGLAASSFLAQEKEPEAVAKPATTSDSKAETAEVVAPVSKNGFIKGFESALIQANKTNKPVFLYVYDSL